MAAAALEAAPRNGAAAFDEAKVEEATQKIGRRIFAGIRRHEPPSWKPAGLENMMMKLMMRDEDLRYRMLRFVDVFPALRSPSAVGKHLEEYLTSGELATGHAPGPLSAMARTLGKHRRQTQGFIKWASRFGIARMGGQFIAGDTPEEVAVKIRRMLDDRMYFSLDLLGEFVCSESQAEHFSRRYLEMAERFGSLLGGRRGETPAGPLVNISIKLSSLTSKFDPMDAEGTSEAVRKRLRPLFRAAKKTGAFINVDMEKYEYRDMTLQILLDLLGEDEFRGFPHIGTVAQAYLRDARESLEWFVGELRARGQQMTIRLVKGAYWDSEQIWARAKGWPVPVITDKRETDANYERCTRFLLENHAIVRTAIGSHNVRSIAHAIALKSALGVPNERFEAQMLYGMAGPIKEALRDMKVPVRIYTPCGDLIQGMAYLVRRILENTANESFLRLRFAEGVSEASLLADPKARR